MHLGDTRQKLCECLGLSEYEAKLYLSLLEQGAAKARTLSMMSGVPRTKVYSVLKKLVDMGLVTEVPEDPRRFVPTPPRTALKSYVHSYQNMVGNLLAVVSSLEEIFRKPKTGQNLQQGTIWTIHGRQEILAKAKQMLCKAKRSVVLATNENGLVLLYKSFNRIFDELTERSVKVKIMTPNDSSNQHMLSELRYTCKIEKTPFPLPLIFLCTDDKQMLLANLHPNSFSSSSEHDRGVFSEDAVLHEMIYLLVLHEGYRWSLHVHSGGDGSNC
mgnify:CR=1 FL=1